MSISQSRIDANRENAQRSTGPKTEEGKKISCLNALRNGFNSPVDVLPHEDMQAYLGLGKEFNETWQPQGAYEARLVQTMTSQHWRNRIYQPSAQNASASSSFAPPPYIRQRK
jgi:hypothetical protein